WLPWMAHVKWAMTKKAQRSTSHHDIDVLAQLRARLGQRRRRGWPGGLRRLDRRGLEIGQGKCRGRLGRARGLLGGQRRLGGLLRGKKIGGRNLHPRTLS